MSQSYRSDVAAAVALMLVCGVAIGFLPNMGKLALTNGAGVSSVVLGRVLIVLALLALYIKLSGGKLLIPKALLGVALVSGIATGIQNLSAVGALNHVSVGLMMLITFIHPLLVGIYYHVTGAMPLTAYRLLLSLLAFIGLALVLAVDFSRLSAVGLLLSASSALFSAVLVISMVRLSKDVGGLTTTFQLSIWSMIVALGGMAAAGEARLPVNTLGWLGIVGSAVAFLVGFVAFLEAAKRIGATRASIFSFTEPIGAILIAAAMYGEQMTATQWIGTLIVAGCLFLLEAPAAFAGRPQQSTTS